MRFPCPIDNRCGSSVVPMRHDSHSVSSLAGPVPARDADTWPNPWPMYRALRDHDPVHHVVPEDKPDHDY